MELEKTNRCNRYVDYNGSETRILPAGAEVEFKLKLSNGNWIRFMKTKVPKGKKWYFNVVITAREFDK